MSAKAILKLGQTLPRPPPMTIRLSFTLPTRWKKKVTAAFDGRQIRSDGGVLLPAGAHRRLGLIETLALSIPDARDLALITHSIDDLLRNRVFAITCGCQ